MRSNHAFLVPLLALAAAACGGDLSPGGDVSPEEATASSEQSLSPGRKPFDSGKAPPLDVAPATMEKEALDLRIRTDEGGSPSPLVVFSYSASNTNSATVNTANFYFNLSAGQTITLGTCGLSGASGSGDTYLRFYDPYGSQVAYNDDSCGLLSNFTYTVPVSGTYRLGAGCFASGSCSGSVAYRVEGVLPFYSTSNTNSATVNTANFYFNLSSGQTITLGTCGVNGASGSGDTYLRFYDPNGSQVAYNDDSCGGLLSNFAYGLPLSGIYRLSAGCFASGSCSGSVAYSITSL